MLYDVVLAAACAVLSIMLWRQAGPNIVSIVLDLCAVVLALLALVKLREQEKLRKRRAALARYLWEKIKP